MERPCLQALRKTQQGEQMSLDVALKIGREYVYSDNITHNLGEMAEHCGLYYPCWRPEEINAKKAKHILPMLESGLHVLLADPLYFSRYNPDNNWGTYDGFVKFIQAYSNACKAWPEANIKVSR
jgi:hypothetical protein